MYVVAVTAALRIREFFGLKPKDVDLERGVLRVSRSMRETATAVAEHAPKTAKGAVPSRFFQWPWRLLNGTWQQPSTGQDSCRGPARIVVAG